MSKTTRVSTGDMFSRRDDGGSQPVELKKVYKESAENFRAIRGDICACLVGDSVGGASISCMHFPPLKHRSCLREKYGS